MLLFTNYVIDTPHGKTLRHPSIFFLDNKLTNLSDDQIKQDMVQPRVTTVKRLRLMIELNKRKGVKGVDQLITQKKSLDDLELLRAYADYVDVSLIEKIVEKILVNLKNDGNTFINFPSIKD